MDNKSNKTTATEHWKHYRRQGELSNCQKGESDLSQAASWEKRIRILYPVTTPSDSSGI